MTDERAPLPDVHRTRARPPASGHRGVPLRQALAGGAAVVKHYYQCHLRRGAETTTGWIEERGARVGATVELLPARALWQVVSVHGPRLAEHMLREQQRLNRGSLPSVERMGP